MTTQEFSDSFDTLINSYSSKVSFGNQDIGFDEYEKSLFLTKAQEEIVLSLYTGKNIGAESFESTEEMRRVLSNIIRETTLSPIEREEGHPIGYESNSRFFTLPEDLWFITSEFVSVDNFKCNKETHLRVYPTRQDEYQNIRNNPFRGLTDRRALRLDLADGVIEILCKYDVVKYYVRYIAEPYPIILSKLPNNLTINKKREEHGCDLHKSLHYKILDRAVQLALQSKGINITK